MAKRRSCRPTDKYRITPCGTGASSEASVMGLCFQTEQHGMCSSGDVNTRSVLSSIFKKWLTVVAYVFIKLIISFGKLTSDSQLQTILTKQRGASAPGMHSSITYRFSYRSVQTMASL